MRIAIDGLHLFGQYSGVHHALANVVDGLREGFPDDDMVLFVPRDFDGPPHGEDLEARDANGLRVKRTWFPGRWRAIRTVWRNFRLQSHAYKEACDVLHGATYALPAMLSMPSVVTIHDLIALTHPTFCTPGSARAQKYSIPRSVKVARRVMVPTETVKREVIRLLKADPARIDVVPWGVDNRFTVIEDKKKMHSARERWRLPERFVLFVGNLEPKKNIEGLIKAFFSAKMHRKLPHALVLAGRMGWGMKGLEKLICDHNARDYILFSGYVPDEALPVMYNLADLLVMPSHVEGFGMPVLEAMACGCPVVISSDPALGEVAGGAARVCQSGGEKPMRELREAIEGLLTDNAGERSELRAKGLERAREFTWLRTAQLTRACYEKAIMKD